MALRGAPAQKRLRVNRWLLIGHTASICTISLMAPTLVIYLQSSGISLIQASVLESVFAIMMACLCLPGGFLADRYGRKPALILGSSFTSVGMFSYYMASSFWGFMVGELLLAVGLASLTGSTQTVMTDSIRLLGGTPLEQANGVASLKITNFLTWMVGALLGGYLATIDLTLPFLLATVGQLFGLVIAFLIVEPLVSDARSERDEVLKTTTLYQARSELANALISSSQLRALLFTSAIFAGLLHTGVVLFAPRWQDSGLSLTQIGILAAAMQLVSVLSTKKMNRLVVSRGEPTLRSASFLGVATGYLLVGSFVSPLGAMCVLLIQIGRAYVETVLAVEIERAAPQGLRTTVLGLRQSIDWIIRAGVLIGSGFLAEAFGSGPVFVGAGSLALMCGAVTVANRRFFQGSV